MPRYLWKDKAATEFLHSLPTLSETELETAYQASKLDFSLFWRDQNPLLNCWIANEFFTVCTALIKYAELLGIDFNLQDYEGKTALITAVKVWSSGPLPKLLIKSGSCDLDHQDKLGRTALHYAYALGRMDVVDELIRHGASLSVRCNKGLTPTDMLACTREEVCNILASVDIHPDRDISATSNSLRDHTGRILFKLSGKSFPQNVKNVTKLLDKFHKHPPTHPYGKALQQALTQQLESYAGCSVLEAIEIRKGLVPLRDLNLTRSPSSATTPLEGLVRIHTGGPEFFRDQQRCRGHLHQSDAQPHDKGNLVQLTAQSAAPSASI